MWHLLTFYAMLPAAVVPKHDGHATVPVTGSLLATEA